MVGKKFFSIILIISLISFSLIGCSQETSNQKSDPLKIGITQIVEHPALDSARQGFIDALADNGYVDGENIELDFQNAQGEMSNAQTIANNFISDEKDLILAIATPVAQATYNATKEIPILITAVTDPVEAGIAKSWEKSGTNVTGTSDATPMKKQFELLKTLIPDAKKVGILYTTSEINSEIQVNQAKELAPDFGFEIETSGITNVNEISQSLDYLLGNIDVLYVPTDNIVVSSMPLIFSKCTEKNIPIIGSESGQVEAGALATEGIDYYNLGYQTGIIAIEVINGSNPQDMAISTLEDTKLVINTDTADKLNITISEDLKEKAEIIEATE